MALHSNCCTQKWFEEEGWSKGLAHVERPLGLACGAGGGLDRFAHVLEERPQREVALHTVELDLLQLREDARAPRHHPRQPHQLVQMELPARPAAPQDQLEP